jgi:hypothetical protein
VTPSGEDRVAEYRPPANVVALEPGRDLAAMVAAGELPAAIGIAADGVAVVALITDATEAGYPTARPRCRSRAP